MQGQKGAVGSLPEGLALEHGSGSSDSGVVEQQLSWSNFIRNPPANVNQETQCLSMWSVGESSSSIVPNQVCPNQVNPKMGHAWSSFVKSQHESGQQELPASRLSLGGVNMNTSHTLANNPHHHHVHNVTVNPSTFISMKPSNHASSSSGPVEMEARQLQCKRKAPELDIGQSSSAIEGSNILQRPEVSNSVWQSVSENPTTNTMPYDPIIPRLGLGIGGIGGVSSDNRAMENFRRNVRIRFDNPHQQDQLPASNNNISNNGLLNFSAQYPSLGLNPVAITGEGSSSREGQPMLQSPVLRRNLYASSRSRNSSSRANPPITSSIISTSGDNLRTTPTNISDHSFIVQPHDTRNTAQTVINLDVDTVGGPTSLSSASNPMLNMGPHRGSSLYRSRRQGEILRRSLLSSIGSGAGGGGGGQNTNLFSSIPPPVGASASSSQESRAPRVIAVAGRHPHHHPAHLRTSSRQLDGAFGLPHVSRTVAGGSGRRGRLMSEMRNVLDRLRRGEGLRFEDVMILDQSVFYGMADIHDQHRDMRLDIDNMSYEELLALEERIGNVNTGLTEENIYKHLKQKTYTHVSGQPDDEPCCICQEEYKNDDDLGALDCGHEFHTSCIKQWLLQKNSCPVCKAAASK